jgi:phenylalanyl-tRNA synthetase beta chain
MKIPLSWLNDYVHIKDIPIKDLQQRMNLAGLETESIEPVGYPDAELPWPEDLVVTAEVVKVMPHPNADRLVLGEVNYGGEENEIIVTGAPSLYEYRGQDGLHLKVAFAWEGVTLYDGHAEELVKRKLKQTKIRGVASRAMVCSQKELGLGDAHEDIIYLPENTPVGIPLVDVLGDYILDFDIKGPFGHLQSVYGIAREISALYQRPVKREPMLAAERLRLTTVPETDFLKLAIPDPDLCPRYTGTMIRDIKIGPSPLWMQLRLQYVGMRPINNIVDITNYVMWELGQPLHAFDYATLRALPGEDKPIIIVRRAKQGEQMATLDGMLRTFDDEMCLITDGGGPVAIGGVMGGLECEVADTTQDIMLEAASFNFINIRRTSQKLKLSSDAASHFGKRVDSELPLPAAARAAELMAELAEGTVDTYVADLHPGKAESHTVEYSPALADRILGIQVPLAEQKRILTSLEFEVVDQGDTWMVTIPPYRLDIGPPVDLVEEVGRVWGYDKFLGTLIDEELPPLRRNRPLEGEERIRDILVSLGLDEVITYSLIDPVDEQRLCAKNNQSLDLPGKVVTLSNPLSSERSQMRRTLLSGALRTAWSNLRFIERIAIFEMGHVYYEVSRPNVAAGDTGVQEPRHVSICLSGPRQRKWWNAVETKIQNLDYFDLKGIVEAMLERLSLKKNVTWSRGTHPSYNPGRCAVVSAGELELGILGELHPKVRDAFDLPEQPVVVLEWNLDTLLEAAQLAEEEKQVGFISSFAPVHEDIALVVDESTPALDVQRAIVAAGEPLVTQALLFDVYRGEQVPPGKKSLAFALTYQSPSRGLNERDVTRLRKRILKELESKLRATLRAM